MKKILVAVFAVFALMGGIATQASAQPWYFNPEKALVRVVYTLTETGARGVKEVGTHLGAMDEDFRAYVPHNNKIVFNENNFTLAELEVQSWDRVYVQYFFYQTDVLVPANNGLWLSGPDPSVGLNIKARQWDANFVNPAGAIKAFYANGSSPAGSVAHMVMDQGTGSFTGRLGTFGSFSTILDTSSKGKGRVELTDLATVGYMNQWMYYFNSPNTTMSGTPVFQIRTYADGSTVINPYGVDAEIPVPAAVYLLGTGLLALVGIRRRMIAA